MLLVGGLLTAGCVFWLQHLRWDSDTHGLSPIFIVLFRYFDFGAASLALGILVLAVFVPRRDGVDRLLRFLGEHPVAVAIVTSATFTLGALGIGWFVHSGHLAHGGAPGAHAVGSFSSVASAFALPTSTLYYARLVGLAKLLLWAAPCVVLLAFAGTWRARGDDRLLTLAACGLVTFVGYLFVWADQGHGWGFRYFHSAWLALPLLATAFLYPPPDARPTVHETSALADVRTYVVACAILSLFAGVGLRAANINEFMTDHLSQGPRYAGTGPRVIVYADVGLYTLDLVQNDPFLRDPVVRMAGVGERAAMAAAIQRRFPEFKRVYADDGGEAWSKPAASLDPR